jgi:tetratricopeptide (TPR) repeat protein
VYSAEELRSDIRCAEIGVADLGPSARADDVADFLRRLDRIANGLEELSAGGADLRAEETRVQTVHDILRRKSGVVVQVLAKVGGLGKLRPSAVPPQSHWWWWLDREVAERKATELRRLAWALFIVAAVVVVVAYVVFLRPDEVTRRQVALVVQGESEALRGDYTAALESYKQALEIVPDDPEANLMVGVVVEALGRPEEAEAQYARARDLYAADSLYYTIRSQKRSLLGWFGKAEADAQKAVELDETLALARCALGTAQAGLGKRAAALRAYQQCADLAQEQEQFDVYVVASMQLATLLQTPPKGP